MSMAVLHLFVNSQNARVLIYARALHYLEQGTANSVLL